MCDKIMTNFIPTQKPSFCCPAKMQEDFTDYDSIISCYLAFLRQESTNFPKT